MGFCFSYSDKFDELYISSQCDAHGVECDWEFDFYGLPTRVACPPVVSASVGSRYGGVTFEIPGLPEIKFGETMNTPEALAYCEW